MQVYTQFGVAKEVNLVVAPSVVRITNAPSIILLGILIGYADVEYTLTKDSIPELTVEMLGWSIGASTNSPAIS